jgi:class 3 adenylate cyclase
MPMYMDRHDVAGVTAEDVAKAHLRDLEVGEKYDVHWVSYWIDEAEGTIFCLAQSPDEESVNRVHRESHGLVANKVIEVDNRPVEQFLGRIKERPPGEVFAETAFRTILFTDMENSTSLTQQLGDLRAMELLRAHDRIIRDSLEPHRGTEVKHTGDGIMASFDSVARAIECSIAIQQRFARHNQDADPAIRVRLGLNAGEPVTEDDDLFGTAVQLAARVCASADAERIYCSSAIRELARGKGFVFEDRGSLSLKGFDEPIQIHEICWQSG